MSADNNGIVSDQIAQVDEALNKSEEDFDKNFFYASRDFRELWFWSSSRFRAQSTVDSCGLYQLWNALAVSARGSDVF